MEPINPIDRIIQTVRKNARCETPDTPALHLAQWIHRQHPQTGRDVEILKGVSHHLFLEIRAEILKGLRDDPLNLDRLEAIHRIGNSHCFWERIGTLLLPSIAEALRGEETAYVLGCNLLQKRGTFRDKLQALSKWFCGRNPWAHNFLHYALRDLENTPPNQQPVAFQKPAPRGNLRIQALLNAARISQDK